MNHLEGDPPATSRPTDPQATPDVCGPGVADDDARLDADIREFVARSLARLQAGGPDVDHLAVIDFAEGGLPPGEDERVRGLVTTYRAWHDAFWLHYDPLDRDPPAGETDGEVHP